MSAIKPELSHPFSSEIAVTGFNRKGSSFPPKHRVPLLCGALQGECLRNDCVISQGARPVWLALSAAIPACGVVGRGLLPVGSAWHGTTVSDDYF